jgi:hypothetical protein
MLAGGAMWKFSPRKWWLKIPAVICGGYLSHYMLDSMSTYQRLRGDNWALIYTLIQVVAALVAWWVVAHQAKYRWDAICPPAMLSGLWAFGCWDWERALGKNYIHWAFNWMPRYLGDCSSNPWTGFWEVALVVGLLVMIVGDGGLYLPSPRQVLGFLYQQILRFRHRRILLGSTGQQS